MSAAPPPNAPVPRATLLASFRYATSGILRTLCTQRNMRIHWVSAVAVMLVGMALDLDLASRATLVFSVGLVLCMEVLNTALEAFVDLHVKQYARAAMVAKDAAAAAVLILAVGSVVVFADILLHRWSMVVRSAEAIERTVALGVPLLVAVGLGLSIRRVVPQLVALLAFAIGCLVPLAWASRDEVFSAGALAFVVTGFAARFLEPRLVPPSETPASAPALGGPPSERPAG